MSLRDEAYPSSEDTFLLLDTLKEDEELLSTRVGDGGIVVEIGCGSGEVSKFVANLIDKNACFLSTDVNTVAISETKDKVVETKTELIRADMFSCFRKSHQFSVVIFNPPYVPTDEEEFRRACTKRDISASWAGGRNGREVTDRFLQQVTSYICDKGIVYLVVIDINNVSDTLEFAQKNGLQGEIIAERSAGIEKLYVLRLYKILGTCRDEESEL